MHGRVFCARNQPGVRYGVQQWAKRAARGTLGYQNLHGT